MATSSPPKSSRRAPIKPIGHDDRLSLIEHLTELRGRLIASVIAFLVCFGITYWQNDALLDIMNRPLDQAQSAQNKSSSKDPLEQAAKFQREIGGALRALAPAQKSQGDVLDALADEPGVSEQTRALATASARLNAEAVKQLREAAAATPTNQTRLPVTLGVTEPFLTTFTVAAYGALLLCLPFLLFQAYAFVLPAFSPAEKRVALPLMLMVPFLFVAGVVFCYFVALPRAVDFLQNFNDDHFDILLQANAFYKFEILLLAAIGLMFQIPVGVLAVTRLGILTPKQLAKNRGYVILGIAILAAVATPTPDPITMSLAMLPLIVLFELSIILARIFYTRRMRAEAEAEEATEEVEEHGLFFDDEGDEFDDPDDFEHLGAMHAAAEEDAEREAEADAEDAGDEDPPPPGSAPRGQDDYPG